jgi:hypothetical protein
MKTRFADPILTTIMKRKKSNNNGLYIAGGIALLLLLMKKKTPVQPAQIAPGEPGAPLAQILPAATTDLVKPADAMTTVLPIYEPVPQLAVMPELDLPNTNNYIVRNPALVKPGTKFLLPVNDDYTRFLA